MSEHEIFVEALRREDDGERTDYLDRACAGDAALRRRVETLLRAHDEAGPFLERPAAEQFGVVSALQRGETDEVGHNPSDVGGGPGQSANEEGHELDFLEPPSRPGSLGRLGHYEVLEVVGRGGMGIVLRALDEKLHRTVAIKVMAAELAASASARKRFTREARAAAAVAHEHVVTIHAVEEDRRPPYLVMQFVEGISLQEKLDRSGPLGLEEILRIGLQVAEGLAAAHKQGLVHRDVKPANILLENGVERVKLTDFGLARAADDASVTQSGVIAGTPQYMSPEQAAGRTVDPRSDLFSLGSVLYAMCTGRPPFRADSALAVLRRVSDEPPRPIREVNPGVPGWLCDLIARFHAKDPSRRIQSASEAAESLAQSLARLQRPEMGLADPAVSGSQHAGLPEKPSLADRVSRPARRRWAAAAAVLVVLTAGLGATEATGVTRLSGTVIHLFNPEGTLIVEVDDPGVSVAIDGRDLVITGAGPKEIRLRPGPHRMTASKDGKVIRQEVVSITRDGRSMVRVSRSAGAAASPRAGGPAPEDLDRLVQLAQQNYERARTRYELGRDSIVDLLDAQEELVEAKLRRAASGGAEEEVDRLFGELVDVRQARMDQIKLRYEAGMVSRSELENVERAVIEARLRREESRATRGGSDTTPRQTPPEPGGPDSSH
jgi:serine/threonine protein kinase